MSFWFPSPLIVGFVWAVGRPRHDGAKQSFFGHLVVLPPGREFGADRETAICGYRPKQGWTQYAVALHTCGRCARIARRLERETLPYPKIERPLIAPLGIPRDIFR
jgi:hypothetical protein